MVVVACAAAGTSFTGQTPANLSSGWVSDAEVYGRGRDGFYSRRRGRGCGVGTVRGCARGRSAEGVLWRRQGASNTCVFVSTLVQTPAGVTNVRISPRVLCKISSWHLGLASLCKFQGKICPRSQDMWAPSQVYRHCLSLDKTNVKPCQMVLAWAQIFPACALGSLASFCYLEQGVLAPPQR
jgi:hypothetical protein